MILYLQLLLVFYLICISGDGSSAQTYSRLADNSVSHDLSNPINMSRAVRNTNPNTIYDEPMDDFSTDESAENYFSSFDDEPRRRRSPPPSTTRPHPGMQPPRMRVRRRNNTSRDVSTRNANLNNMNRNNDHVHGYFGNWASYGYGNRWSMRRGPDQRFYTGNSHGNVPYYRQPIMANYRPPYGIWSSF